MFGIHNFGLFLAAGVLLNLTPGPDTLYILGRSVAQGREAGVASALGISLGSIFHTCAAALGLSAILATSAFTFVAIKLLGGAYLVFLGIKMILDRRRELTLPSNFRRRTTIAAFRQGSFDEHSQSESCAVFPRLSPAIHRSGVEYEDRCVHRTRPNVRNHRNDLVSRPRLLRVQFQRAIAPKMRALHRGSIELPAQFLCFWGYVSRPPSERWT